MAAADDAQRIAFLRSLGYETADVYGGIQAYRGAYLEWESVDKSMGG